MENASKALMMAGAVLITIMVFAIAMYFYAQYSEFPAKQEEAIKQRQITKFNQEYESYDKKRMYGTDVVTIMNKVISNNKSYADPITGRYEVKSDNHFINVEITLLTDVKSYAIQYKEIPDSNGLIDTINYDKGTIKGYINNKGNETTFELGTVFSAKRVITLLNSDTHSQFVSSNVTVEEFFQDQETYKIRLSSGSNSTREYDEFNYTMVYSGFIDFKRKFFECTGIEYNPETSRVSSISFKEIDITD